MTTRRGIFFNSKSRSMDSNIILDNKNPSPTNTESSNIIINEDQSGSSSSNSQGSPPKLTNISTGIVKKKLILKSTKRTLTKTIYSGPRKIFSTSYKANRAQLNPKAFFGSEINEYDLDNNNEETSTNICSSQPTIEQRTISKTSLVVKSKSTDSIRTTTTTIIENGKTKLICPRDQKKMYTIVPNIRQPTTCEELGETQSYIDDMEYLLAGFQSDKLLGSRCLSAVKFAELCVKPSFRMHLRTESALERVLDLLKDAPEVPSLNLCTAFILYVLSSDTLTSGINLSTVRLMIELVHKSPSKTFIDDEEYKKMKQRILTIINQSLQDDIFYEERFNTYDIILETFVNISRNNLKEWLRNETRTLNAFDLMIDAISSIVQDLSNNDFECYSLSEILIRYRKVCRYINMLEEFCGDNSEQTSSVVSSNIDINRMYIAQYNQYSLFHSLSKLLDLSLVWFKQHSSTNDDSNNNKMTTASSTKTDDSKSSDTCDIFRDGCKTIMSILIILTNDCETHCDRLTSDDRFFSNLFRLLITIEQSSLASEDKFDSLALTLNLLINLVQNTKHVYKHLMEDNMPGGSSKKIYEYLAGLFCEQESLAAKAESQEENDWMMEDGDDNLDERLGIQNPKNNNENGANFNRALQKAAGHMENTFVAAFSGVILAVVLLRDRATYASQIQALMPQKKFDTMAFILQKFFVFMRMSHAFTPSGIKILEEIMSMVLSLCG
ncbi:unnamed protein product [Rotaria sordida]|uniref:WAPL domain-containing protein n=1 Tax=Rotaria sordida TaxID=392033 RepID=A0A818IDG0_9BILA|nr:unnamed protein product [Rotaria sordida]CAF1380016.1 unnamed protein product [Rotaria sordida]CAF3524567.1 unnamed protein product [Rotaria sordida]CAF3655141.1 unnamed protein product [Rotaria sordida]